MAQRESGILAERRAEALRKRERHRSHIFLSAIIVVSLLVPTCVTVLFIGNERAQGIAILVLALLIVGAGFFALFRRPLPKSHQSPGEPPPTQYTGFHGW